MPAAFHDLVAGERLAFQNVVSSRAKFHYSEMAEHFDHFASRVGAQGGEPKGPFFYSLNNVPLDEMVDVEMFLPIRQNTFAGGVGFRFHSYFEVSPLLRGVVQGDFENQAEMVYAQLLAALEANNLDVITPFYHVLQQDVSPYALIYLGYADAAEVDGAAAT